MSTLHESIEVFDPESFGRSTRRAKASKEEVKTAIVGLMDALKDLITRIE
jgi:hypothetical protein